MRALFSRSMAAAVIAAAVFAAVGAARAETSPVIYSFKGGKLGAKPSGGLVNFGGTLYGTTAIGGGTGCEGGCGIVFAMSPDGFLLATRSFAGGSDSATPYAGLIDAAGTLYGTTYNGGGGAKCADGCGTVFGLTESPKLALYSFEGGEDGANPRAPLTYMGGALYGTTYSGGGSAKCAGGCGTVFKLEKVGDKWVEIARFDFAGGADGANPYAGLVDVGGTLYGTTVNGGEGCGARGCGTVFAVTPKGLSVRYRFKGGSDGANPFAALIYVGGGLYGTTFSGGGSPKCDGGCGTVFKLELEGDELFELGLRPFAGGADGAHPFAALVNVGGGLAFYGTTAYGGLTGDCFDSDFGCGTVFEWTTNGISVLYPFKGGADDGANPTAPLIYVSPSPPDKSGMLYGTTLYGGVHNCSYGCGTVFAMPIKP